MGILVGWEGWEGQERDKGRAVTTQLVFSMKANVMKERQRPKSGDGVQGWGKEGLTAAYDKGERGGDKRGMGGRRGRRGEAPVAQQQVDKDCSVWMRTTFAFVCLKPSTTCASRDAVETQTAVRFCAHLCSRSLEGIAMFSLDVTGMLYHY